MGSMELDFCINCMEERAPDITVCDRCGFDLRTYMVEPHHLAPGTLLNGRFLVGRVLGEGGFGITYVGKDTTLDLKVAIKEFYMSGYVNRNATISRTVQPNTGDYREIFEKNREKFLDEAKILAKFTNEAGIVGVREFLRENNTAYIIMNFVSGETLRARLDRMERIPWQECLSTLAPVLVSLGRVHERGIIHRDISPDNIMLTDRGEARLLDFGAARDVSGADGKSLSVILKQGYAPEEQYRSKGKQGPWTDIYAFCATIYRCITGVIPEEAMERLRDDPVVPPVQMRCGCPAAISGVIMKGMSVYAEDRYQTVAGLFADLERARANPEDGDIVSPKAREVRKTRYVQHSEQERGSKSETKLKSKPHPEPKPRSDSAPKAESKQRAFPKLPAAFPRKKLLRGAAAVAGVTLAVLLAIRLGAGDGKTSDSQNGGDQDISPAIEAGDPSDLPLLAETGKIEWADPTIRDAILEALGKEESEITDADLTGLEVLNLPESDEGVSTLSDLEKLTGLTELRIISRSVADFTFPEGMGALEVLNLSSTGCEDISFLSLPQMQNLAKLDLSGNQVTDLEPVAGLSGLTYLNISDNPVTSLDALSGLENLERLDASGIEVSDWTPAKHIAAVKGSPAVTGVKLSQNSLSLETDKSAGLTATVSPDNAIRYTLAWSSSNGSVASVDDNGLVTAKSAGSATITVTCNGNTDTCTVRVSSNQTVATAGNSGNTGSPGNKGSSGKTGNSGNTGNSGSAGDAGNSSGKTESPGPAGVTSVSMSRSSLLLDQGGTAKLSVSILPADATGYSVTWSSSNSSVVTVDGNGNVNAISSGSAVITAMCNGHSATCTVTVQ